MAQFTLNSTFTKVKKRLGNIIFYDWDGGTFARSWEKPRDPKTKKQKACRDIFRKAVKSWQALSLEEKSYWNAIRLRPRVKGYNAYLSVFVLNRWDLVEVTERRFAAAPGTVYIEKTGASPAFMKDHRQTGLRSLRSPFVAPSFRLKKHEKTGISATQ
jgi:hypothetical protein